MDKICPQCGITFKIIGRPWNKKYCSKECTKKMYHVPFRLSKDVPSGTVGAIAELEVCSDLLKRGYSVFRSVSPSSNFDLIAFKDRQMISVEVRTGYFQRTNGNLMFPKNETDKAQYYAVVTHHDRKIYYIPELEI